MIRVPGTKMTRISFAFLLLTLSSGALSAPQYDVVIEGGRVMDPETGADGVRNIGIRGGKIARISPEALSGGEPFMRRASSSRRVSSTCTSTARTSPTGA
jgi:hypothetical protein